MTITTLTVSTCILWCLIGFILGVSSMIALGLSILKKRAKAQQSATNRTTASH